ncbi:MAG: hypothetical protein AAFO04_29765 [Cyanobacteria bacterium J06592_8]
MKNRDFDSFSILKFKKGYQSEGIATTIVVVSDEYFESPVPTQKPTQTSGKGVIFAFGMIAVLTVVSLVQLHRSIKVTPVNPEITQQTTHYKSINHFKI